MPKTVQVAVSNATFHFDKLYTYAVLPDQQAVRRGSMVLVPFGRGSKARMGVVLAVDAEPENGAYLDSMAWYLYCTGSYEEAWQMIQLAIEAMEEEPSLGVVLEHAGDIALKLGKKEEALQLYYQALGDFLSPDLDLQAVRKKIEQVKKELNGGKDKK